MILFIKQWSRVTKYTSKILIQDYFFSLCNICKSVANISYKQELIRLKRKITKQINKILGEQRKVISLKQLILLLSIGLKPGLFLQEKLLSWVTFLIHGVILLQLTLGLSIRQIGRFLYDGEGDKDNFIMKKMKGGGWRFHNVYVNGSRSKLFLQYFYLSILIY